jgi:ADP-ribose pyrophosphatase YjhB (NUDIX family)
VKDGRSLVTVRAREPEKGRIDVPGGFLDAGEDPIQGLKREVREEVGLEIDVKQEDFVQAIAHRYGPEGDWLLALGFKARWVAGEVQARDDVADALWVDGVDIDRLDFAWPHDRDLVRKALQNG